MMNASEITEREIPPRTLENFSRSLDYMERARELMPFGVASSKRATQRPTPLVIDHAKGSRLYDIDGNEYIDYVAGGGPMLLGHQSEPVIEAVRKQLERGTQYALAHEGELELAERVCRLVPGAEMVTFLSSGSEAVHLALAIARGATGRRRVLKFDGAFDGWIAPMCTNMPGGPAVGPERPYALRPNAGWNVGDEDVVICPWNDPAAFEAVMEEHGDSLAAVITEPAACNVGGILPLPGFLEFLREQCDKYGTVLIFDEVITGFRLAPGGAQERFGVTPDLATFAKAMANGFSISAVAGRRSVMSAATDGPVRTRGTYNGNPVVVAAANAMLAELENRGKALYDELERRSTDLAEGINAVAAKHGVPLRANRVGSVLALLWGLDKAPTSYRDVARSDFTALGDLEEQLNLRGICTIDGQRMFVSAAHTDEDIAQTIEALDQALTRMTP